MSMASTKLPAALPARIECVMRALYGRRWRSRGHVALGIARQTLHCWLQGDKPCCSIDLELLRVIADGRVASAQSAVDLDALEKAINKQIGQH